ncbi:phosphoserine phosphatase SerB [Dongia sp.]|uniref:phosphoserine phosphatase SerB n=1 Tax=Dongia sp. TaxID=1977262 RepID=UPI0035B4AE17
MDLVLTLVSAPDKARLEPALLAEIAAALSRAGAKVAAPLWLDPAIACDLAFGGIEASHAQNIAMAMLGGEAVDCYAQGAGGRKKRLLLCDMDSTIVTAETLDDLSVFANDKAEIDALTQKSIAGEMNFTQSLIARVALLKGLTEAEFAAAYLKVEVSPGAETLIRTLRRDGCYTALVSGGFRYFTSRVAARVGFDIDISNDFEMADGKTTGKLMPPIVDPDGEFGKLGRLRHLAKECGIDLSAAAAIGDGSNDIPMLSAAGMGCGYRGKPKVKAATGCQLNYANLTGLLFYMGYRRDEFVT